MHTPSIFAFSSHALSSYEGYEDQGAPTSEEDIRNSLQCVTREMCGYFIHCDFPGTQSGGASCTYATLPDDVILPGTKEPVGHETPIKGVNAFTFHGTLFSPFPPISIQPCLLSRVPVGVGLYVHGLDCSPQETLAIRFKVLPHYITSRSHS
jgi:hypothetical protein